MAKPKHRLDLTAAWADTRAMLSSHRELVIAITGMFFVLPGIVFSWLLTPEGPVPKPKTNEEALAQISAVFSDNWHWFLGNMVVTTIGAVALLTLIFDRSRPTVAEAIRMGLVTLPAYLLLNFLQSAIVAGGILLLILPGLYLGARLSVTAPVLVAEGTRNPIAIIARSFAITRGNGFRIMGYLAVLIIVGVIVNSVVTSLIGIVIRLAIDGPVGLLLTLIVDSTIMSALSAVLIYALASVYRALVPQAPPAGDDQSGLA